MKFNRVLLKLSGEALMGENQFGIDNKKLDTYAKEIKTAHARGIEIEAGSTYVYTKDWIPDRAGTMWIEFQIINGPLAQTETVYVDEQRSEGLLSGISSINPVLLIIIFLLTVSLFGLLIFGLKSPEPRPSNLNQKQSVENSLSVTAGAENKPPQQMLGPYGAPEQAASPGENPYK